VSKIRYERTLLLTPHPMLERVGTMLSLATHFQVRAKKAGKNRDDHKEMADELEGDMAALVESVKAHGILEPIKICRIPDDSAKLLGQTWWIVDGRNRWNAAKFADLRRVPVIRVSTADAPAIIAATVAGRRHYSKGATAYLAMLLHPEVALENAAGRKSRTECGIISMESLGAKFSVSLRLMEQAAELFRLLEGEGKPFREDAEANIWAGCGLGGVKAGVDSLIKSGKEYTEVPADEKRRAAAWVELQRGLKTLGSTFEKWKTLTPEQTEKALPLIRNLVESAPSEVRSALLDGLAAKQA
jgi:hypothetical protein